MTERCKTEKEVGKMPHTDWKEIVRLALADEWRIYVSEWRKRTRFGKVLYPLWLVARIYKIVALSLGLSFVYLMLTVARAFEPPEKPRLRGRIPKPRIYKSDDE